MKKVLGFIALFVFVLGCKKDEMPKQEVNDPMFMFEGVFNEEHITRQAGNEGYYMYSSHSHDDASGLYIYQGDLKQETCPGSCDYALTVKINDSKVTLAGAAMDPASALFTGPYLLNDLTKIPSTQKVIIKPERLYNFSETYIWKYFGPDSLSPTETYSIAPYFKLGSTYTVQVAFNDNTGACQTNLTNIFRVGNAFQTTITPVKTDTSKYQFDPKIAGTGAFTYFWEFGDGTTSSEKSPMHVYPRDTTWLVKLTVTNGQEVAITYCQVGSCNANFEFLPQPLDITKLFKTITFELRDPSGRIYTSAGVNQPASSSASVTGVWDYPKKNKLGDKTKKISLEFACLMQGPDKVIECKNGKATIAVSYK